MKALVTGGAGFIGSNLVSLLLEKGHQVTTLDNLTTGHLQNLNLSAVEFIQGDVRDFTLLNELVKGHDVIFHLAASIGNKKSIEFPQNDSEINVLGTINILEAAKNNSIKTVIYSSSAAIFGELLTMPIDESHPTNPSSPYGVSKLAAEKHVLCWGSLYKIKTIALRYFNVYGVNQRFDEYGNVIPIFAERLYNYEKITVYGDGQQTRDFVNVRDVAMANYLAATSAVRSGVYNVGSGTCLTINRLVTIMKMISGKDVKVEYAAPRDGEVLNCMANISKIQQELGFKPQNNISDLLSDYWCWFKNEKALKLNLV